MIKSFADKTGKSEKEIDELWGKAKEIASKEGRKDDSAYIVGILKKSLGLKEQELLGKHNNIPDEDFDSEQLAIGIEVEYEHTDSEDIAKGIAKDHLAEDPDYYKKLLSYVEENMKSLKEAILKGLVKEDEDKCPSSGCIN